MSAHPSFANVSSDVPDVVTLALDTATPFLTLALVAPQGSWEVSREVGRAHAELLPEAAQSLFEEAGLPFRAQQIVIGTGPGSYTGVRVGASYALGLARAWGANVLGVSSLAGLVGEHEGQQTVALDARKGQVYAATYRVSGGAAVEELAAPAKLPQPEAQANAAYFRQDVAPSGLALLRAGLQLGTPRWELAYL